MKRILILIFLLGLILLHSGCTTIEERAAHIRASESVLFECRVKQGRILLSERHIAWETDGEVPLLVTPTTLYFGDQSILISQIDSVEVKNFEHAGELFINPYTIRDLVIIQSPLANFWNGLALRISPEGEGAPDSDTAKAVQLKRILEAAQYELDPFGRVRQPRPVWIGFCAGEVRAIWNVEPRYLHSRFPGQDERVMDCFRKAGGSSQEVQASRMKQLLCEKVDPGEDAYRFNDAGTLSLRGPRLPGPVRKYFRDGASLPECIALVDVPLIFLEEKMDPYGNVSILMRIRTSVRLMDLERLAIGSELVDSCEVRVPINNLLQDGITHIHDAVDMAARQAAGQLQTLFSASREAR